MNRIFTDAKRLLLGIDGSENTPLDFKEEISESIAKNIIDKAKATLLMTARKNADKFGEDIDKKQIADISGKSKKIKEKIKQEEYIEEKDKKERSEKEKEDKRKKQESLRQTMQRIAQEDEREQIQTKNKQKGE